MKAYLATFHGDIQDKPPLAGNSLDEVLVQIQAVHNYGYVSDQGKSHGEDWIEYYTPDPEDDKIEIWEVDGDNNTAKIVWGFWGWHWQIPEGLEQGRMPGQSYSLYELANT